MKIKIYVWIIVAGLIIGVSGCGSTDSNGGETDPPVSQYNLIVNTSPDEGGSVTPSSGQYDEDSNVSVTATANEDWEFVEWTGDISSTDNPLSFNIQQNTSITAHFRDMRSVYKIDLTVSDQSNELDLAFGQVANPADLDEEAPPSPPEDALHAYFERDSDEFFGDFRSSSEKEVSWILFYQSGSGDELTLSWIIDDEKFEGTLSLLDDNGNELVADISAESTFTFTASDYNYVEFKYIFE